MTKVLFVCLGNICRSPMAEAIFRHKVIASDLDEDFHIESAGTGDWHIGENPDPRTIKVLYANRVMKFSRAQQLKSPDFDTFDYIVAMDVANVRDINGWERAQPNKVSLMSSWNPKATKIEVPDPYYGDLSDFENVFKMLDEATEAMLTKLKN